MFKVVSGTPGEIGEVSSLAIGAFRSFIALLLTVLILWPIDCKIRGQSLRLPTMKLKSSWVWASAVSRAVNTLAFATAIVFCSVSTGYLLCNMTIIGMLFWQWLINKKLPSSWQLMTALVVVASCIAYFAIDEHHATSIGVVAGIIGLFSFSGFFFFNQKIAENDGKECILGAVMLSHILAPLFAMLAVGVCFFFSGEIASTDSWARLWQPFQLPSAGAVVILLLIGIFQGGLPDWLIAKGQALGPNMMFMAFVPTLIMLWAPFLAWRTIGEDMFTPAAAIPFAVVHAAILYGSLRGAREAKLRLAAAE